jgi:hypothetical protein
MTVKLEGDFVVFHRGLRINRCWKVHKWLPAALTMPKLLEQLAHKLRER